MIPITAKVVRCFLLAKQVIHYYWVHTAADDKDGRVSVENVHTVIERMIRLPIKKVRTFTTESPTVRGAFVRHKDSITIYIRDAQGELWERFTAIKELCHALMDGEADYSTDAVKMIRELKQFDGVHVQFESLSAGARADKLAELMALELIYPFEFRERDQKALLDGETIGSISARRGVPSLWVEHALGDAHFNACAELWSALPDEPLKNRLQPL